MAQNNQGHLTLIVHKPQQRHRYIASRFFYLEEDIPRCISKRLIASRNNNHQLNHTNHKHTLSNKDSQAWRKSNCYQSVTSEPMLTPKRCNRKRIGKVRPYPSQNTTVVEHKSVYSYLHNSYITKLLTTNISTFSSLPPHEKKIHPKHFSCIHLLLAEYEAKQSSNNK